MNYKRAVLRITGLYAFRSLRSLQGSGWLGRSACGLTPTPASTHIFAALVFATQSPYSGCKNLAYSRNVMRNVPKKFNGHVDKNKKIC
jgi:hypothetical protein